MAKEEPTMWQMLVSLSKAFTSVFTVVVMILLVLVWLPNISDNDDTFDERLDRVEIVLTNTTVPPTVPSLSGIVCLPNPTTEDNSNTGTTCTAVTKP